MGSGRNFRQAMGMAGYAGISVVLIFLAILPLDHVPGALPGPDVLLAVTVLWVIRRPDLAPVWLVACVFLLADLLLTRPPGLGAAAVVLTTEYLRRRSGLTTEVSFLMEWSVAASMMASVMIGTATVLVLVAAPAPGIGPLLVKLVGTVLVYPLVAGVAHLLFGIRKAGGGGQLGFGGVR
jgi:rod shape-determining protein MreD